MMFYLPDPTTIKRVMRQKNYVVFGGSRGYDLNLIGVRTKDMTANVFNDWLSVMYLDGDKWILFAFPATTDPGTYYRLHPMNVSGTALLKPGQYRGAYKVGEHKGYVALQQAKPLKVYRDANRDNVLDADESTVQEGMFAINIHRASKSGPSEKVDKWSAGCQVLQDPKHFGFLLNLAMTSSAIYGNSFTYTLLEESDFAE